MALWESIKARFSGNQTPLLKAAELASKAGPLNPNRRISSLILDENGITLPSIAKLKPGDKQNITKALTMISRGGISTVGDLALALKERPEEVAAMRNVGKGERLQILRTLSKRVRFEE